STAGAYLEHVTTSFAEYLRLYEASWLKLQTTSPRLSSYEDRSLYTTWQVTFDQIRKQNAASALLLKLWAYFDKQDVWFELLQHAARHEHFTRNGNVGIEGIEWALHNLGMLYAGQGKLADAEVMYSRALQGYEEALGPKHTSTLVTVNNLGNLYKNQGKLAEA